MTMFPEWGSYAPGIAPMLATSGAYILLGIIGHGLMRLVAGAAKADRLASRNGEECLDFSALRRNHGTNESAPTVEVPPGGWILFLARIAVHLK